jgi:PAS domain S-box-containing protein
MQINKHYLRKENLLFPYLEKHGFYGPSSVMWAIHDDIRAKLKELQQILTKYRDYDFAALVSAMKQVAQPLSTAITEMIYKENNILYPAALERLSDAEWLAIKEQSAELGYCLIQPGDEWPQAITKEQPAAAAQPAEAPVIPSALSLDTGSLTPQEINLLLKHLPVDITFVDKDDTVRYFSQTPERIFPRAKAIIGRKVQNCHPPASIHVVNRILDDFRQGKRDVAEFWIQMKGKFVHIRYFAVRDENGAYVGTIEVTQDITRIRELTGERRLLEDA